MKLEGTIFRPGIDLASPDRPRMNAVSNEKPRIIITLTEDEFHDVHGLAFRAGTSVSRIAQLAIVRLMVDAETGALPLLPEFRFGYEAGHG